MIDADRIADALGRPRPTPQQRAVIESPLEPALVVAGAGSGKTETMASRVLWLLANGHIGAGDILGLTFTRKAAGELSARIRERIVGLAAAGLLPSGYDDFDPPTVATYNSFANAIYRDNAILIGRESDGTVLGPASAWQLMRRVVVGSTDERLLTLDRRVDPVTAAALSLSHALSENVVDPREVEAFADEFLSVEQLPLGGRALYEQKFTGMVSAISQLPVLLALADEFERLKLSRGLVEYSDQVALALQIVRRVPTVRDELRNRYRVVLLDEYQDTSVVQTWLLAELFRGGAVMAVGDPNQSIYGWRGASAANLGSFPEQFGSASTFALSTSWRNGHDVLAVANALVQPLAQGRVPVERLQPGPGASGLPVEVAYEETLDDEAERIAGWLESCLIPRSGPSAPSAAILFRARKTQRVVIDALRRHGIPYHVLGVGGLMAEPEIADLVCALTVLDDPAAGSELVRLLSGSRWSIGVRDLRALSRLASWLRDRDYAGRLLDEAVRERIRASVSDDEGGSIVDALDFLVHAREGHTALEDFTEEGLARLRDAGSAFARLRARSGLELPDLVGVVVQELRLDIEVVANETRPHGPAVLDAFFDAVASYLGVSEGGALGGFLGWLREAEWREDLTPRPEDPEPGTVQLLTIHASKGLEWDVVVVPRVVEDELPERPQEGTGGWLRFGELPYEFRGDAGELPQFHWRPAATRKELIDAREQFAEAVGRHRALEERRLMYVAVTRARHRLLLTGSFWSTQIKPRRPSPFLLALSADGVIGPLPDTSRHEENPLGESAALFDWPLDPLGSRRPLVESAARLVREAVPGGGGRWAHELELLLRERHLARTGQQVALPVRVPASRFKDFVSDPAGVAQSLRRPMPEKPYRATRLGTVFHSWVEERFGVRGASEAIDSLESELDADELGIDAARFAALRETFERSPWGSLQPIEVEREIHLPFDGRIVVCKIDAVYERGGRIEIVDWKTGKAPKDADDLERKQLQLALYRLAYSRWKGIDPASVDAVFYFVADDVIIAPEHIDTEEELLTRWRSAIGPSA